MIFVKRLAFPITKKLYSELLPLILFEYSFRTDYFLDNNAYKFDLVFLPSLRKIIRNSAMYDIGYTKINLKYKKQFQLIYIFYQRHIKT